MANLECRMYEAKYPSLGETVMVQVKEIGEMNAYVSLLEYNNIEGMIQFSELSKRRIKRLGSLIRVGSVEPLMVVKVDEARGYVDLSKKSLVEEDVEMCGERFSKSKLVHSVLRYIADTFKINLEDLYINIGWPLYRKYGHAFEAFKLIASDPESVLDSLTRTVQGIGLDGQEEVKVIPAISEEVKNALVKDIKRRMTPQPVKLRADIQMWCFEFDGVLHIKDAMRKAKAAGTDDCPVKIMLVAPPFYALTVQTLDKEKGMTVLYKAVIACTEEIERHGGKLVVMKAFRAVSEEVEDKLLSDDMAELINLNDEKNGTAQVFDMEDEECTEEED